MDLNSFAVPIPPFYNLHHQDLPLDALAERFRNLPFLGNEKNAKIESNSDWAPEKKEDLNSSPKHHYVKRPWSLAEDRLLVRLVRQHGAGNWSHIAQMMHGRIGKQCSDRWHNNLRPGLKKKTWSEEENRILIQVHSEFGNNWSQIARRLPGRSQNSIKNHWNTSKRKQLSFQRSRRSSQPKTESLLQSYTRSPDNFNAPMTMPTSYTRSPDNFNAPMTMPTSPTTNDNPAILTFPANNFMDDKCRFVMDVARETDRDFRNEDVRMELDLSPETSGCNSGRIFCGAIYFVRV